MTSLISRARLATKPDTVLVALTREGSDAAFTAIVDRHRRGLQRHCRSLLAPDQVDDAVQLTFLRAFQALRAGTDVRELAPWLHRIARNVAFTELAARTAEQHVLDEEPEDRRGSEVAERREELRAALGAVAALPEPQRAAVIRAVDGASHATIAQELGVSEVAARQILHRARTVLRAAVQAVTPPPVLWLARRASALTSRLPAPPPGLDPIAPKLAAVVTAAALVAAPTLRHVGEAVVGVHQNRPPLRLAAHTSPVQVSPTAGALALATVASPARPDWPIPASAGTVTGDDGRSATDRQSRAGGRVSSGGSAGAGTSSAGSPQGGPPDSGASNANSDNTDPSASDASAGDSTDQSGSDPSADGSTSTDPTSTDATSTDASSTDSTSTDPTSTDPTSTDPTSTDPTSTDPTSTDATSTDPTSTDPTSTDATSTDPTATSGP